MKYFFGGMLCLLLLVVAEPLFLYANQIGLGTADPRIYYPGTGSATVVLVNVHPGDSLSVTAGSGITGCYNKCV